MVKLITGSYPTLMACECELLSTPAGEIHPYPTDDNDVCSESTYTKVEDKNGDYLWLCEKCFEHNC
tara:strand:+ start:1208 stop:1405 length:198 start_codon:yes stop_codon:yes gene_type:complete